MTTDHLDLDKLEAVAKAATPGEWCWHQRWLHAAPGTGEPLLWYTIKDDGVHASLLDQEHIAAFDPPTALALIARARKADALEAENERLREGLKPFAEIANGRDFKEVQKGQKLWLERTAAIVSSCVDSDWFRTAARLLSQEPVCPAT